LVSAGNWNRQSSPSEDWTPNRQAADSESARPYKVALLASVICPVRLKEMARFREFRRDFAAGDLRGKKFLMVCAYQSMKSPNQAE